MQRREEKKKYLGRRGMNEAIGNEIANVKKRKRERERERERESGSVIKKRTRRNRHKT